MATQTCTEMSDNYTITAVLCSQMWKDDAE